MRASALKNRGKKIFDILILIKNRQKRTIFARLLAYVINLLYLCGRKGLNHKKLTSMEAVRQTSYDYVNAKGNPMVDSNPGNLKGRPIEEFMDELAKRLGKHYGLNDIREAL